MAIHAVGWNEPFPEDCRGGALTIGNFDGVHLGHHALLAELRRQANGLGGPAVAMTFDPPPSQLLRPGAAPAALMTIAERTQRMLAGGTDHVLVLRTTPELLQRTAREFFDRVIHRGLAAKTVVPGFNFAFGHNREGTVETLVALCREAGVLCIPVPPLHLDGQPVSSSRIRGALLRGDVAAARKLLGRPYGVTGTVVAGQRRGQTLGFPTANLEQIPTLVPGNGVYAVRIIGDRSWAGAANIGPNPTFGEEARKIEVHLLDFAGDLYGARLRVDFLERLRDTRKFAGVAELREQLRADIAAARHITTMV
jgi:riboflavin kinase/FMN adenylyltransferase